MSYSDHFLSVVRPSVRPLTLLDDNSSKAIEPICPLFGKNVAWVGGFKNSYNYGDRPLGLVAMATESSHRPIENCIFSIISEVM